MAAVSKFLRRLAVAGCCCKDSRLQDFLEQNNANKIGIEPKDFVYFVVSPITVHRMIVPICETYRKHTMCSPKFQGFLVIRAFLTKNRSHVR